MKMIRWILRLVPLGVGLLLLLTFVFVGFGRVERTVDSEGEVRVKKYVVARPQVSGLVSLVKVESGDEVERGQVLVQLQDHELQQELLLVRQSRQEAESKLDKLLAEFLLRQQEIHPLELRQGRYEVERGALEAALGSSRVTEAQIELEASKERHREAAELADLGLLSQRDLKEAWQAQLAAEQRLIQSRLQEQLVAGRRPALTNDLELLESEHRRLLGSLDAEVRDLRAQVAHWAERRRQLDELQGLHTVRATMEGVVIGSPVNELLGQYVQAGEALFNIIDVSSIFFVTHVPEQALVQVRPGQLANVEIDGLPKRKFKIFSGRVDKIVAHDLGPIRAQELPLYPVHIQLQSPWLGLEEGRFYLRSGMRGTAKIAYRRNMPMLEVLYDFLVGNPQVPVQEAEPQTKSPARARSIM